MFKKLSTKLWAIAVTLMMVLSVTVTGFAAAGDVPAHNKRLTNNNDGTYKLSLDIKGETETYVNKVNVLVILDTSTSMTQKTGGQQRITAAKKAINSMANQLLGLNGQGENPNDAVEMALLRFGTTASVVQQPTTSRTGFTNAVNNIQVQQNQGTNWEDAMQDAANNITFDSDRTFVIFVSDGNPTFRNTRGNYNPMDQYYYSQWGVYGDGSTTIARCYDHAKDDAASLAQKYGADNFYTIGAYGDVSRMQSLTTDAGAPANHYFSATNTAELNNALESIIEDIRRAGIGDAQINDPTTANVTATSGEVSHLLTVDETSFKYYKNGEEWADAPAASVVNGEVVWDLGDGLLDDGVTYTVKFDCWPSQETYDLIADLNNGKKSYDSLDANIKQYLIKSGDSYTLLTNKNPSITYTDTRTTAGPQTVAYDNPPPVATDVERMSIEKLWENDLDTRKGEPVTLKVKRDANENYDTITLNEGNDWKSSTYIATGLMRANMQAGTIEVLETGHDYRLIETGSATYYWDFFTETVHPMVINGVETKLVEVEDEADIPAGMTGKDCYNDGTNSYYRFNGKVYISKGTESTLQAENHRRSCIDVTKEISEGADKADPDAMFEYTFSVDDAKSDDGQVWFSVVDENGELVKDLTTNATAETSGGQNTGYYHAANGSNITFEMKAGWNMRILNLPNGAEFSIEETDMPANFVFDKITVTPEEEEGDYTVSGQKVTGTVNTSNTDFKFKYANKYEGTEVPVEKIWDDNNNQDGIRPEKVTVNLLADGEKIKSQDIEVADDGTWKYTFKDLPKYNDDKEPIEYTVTEEAVPNYTTTITGNATDGFKITNQHIPETVTVTVTKQWSDAEDQDGYRPPSISVALKADGDEKDSVELSDDNKWTHSWTDLDKYADGKVIAYTVQEGDIPSEYEVTVTKTTDTETAVAYTVNNRHETDKTSMDVEKIWNDDDDLAKLRPTSVDVQLSDADGNKYDKDGKLVEGAAEDYVSVTLSADNNWKYTWETLEKKRAGKEIEYSVDEVGVPKGYIKTKNGAAITNTHENTTYSVKKTWNDDQNRDGIRPSSISVQLYANGKAEGDTVTLNASNDWSYTWDILPANDDDGNPITYTADETAVPDDYTKDVTHSGTQSLIINTHDPAKDEVVVEKVWNDENDLAGLRPSSIKVQLKRNGKNYGDPVTLNEDNDWTHKWSDLLVNSDGQKIEYTVDEVSVPKGYIKTVTNEGNFYVITNTHENTSFQVNKVWEDADDQDGKRPSSIKVVLKRNGTTIDTVTLNEDNEWQHRWAVLPKNDDDGNEYSYSADETEVPEGYEKTIKATDTSAVITNKHDPSQTTVDVVKQWVDDDDRDRIRPESVSVVLLADGKQVGDAVELNADNNWANTWADLDEYSKGKKIDYTVKEENVPEGYSVKVVKTGEGFAYTVVNKHEPAKTKVSGTKTWDDNNDKLKKRPDSIIVNLYADGKYKTSITVKPDKDGNWKYTFDDLDKFKKEGKKIKYTVTEDKVEGYKKPIIKGYDITNPIKPEKPVIPVTGDPTTLVSLLILLAAGAVLVPVTRRRKHQ